MIVITSQYGAVDMWDWELISYMLAHGLTVFLPYNTDLGKVIFCAFGIKEAHGGSKIPDVPGRSGRGHAGLHFKRFYPGGRKSAPSR